MPRPIATIPDEYKCEDCQDTGWIEYDDYSRVNGEYRTGRSPCRCEASIDAVCYEADLREDDPDDSYWGGDQ
jgi:hypothetical protein